MENGAITILVQNKLKNVIKEEKDLTMTFFRDNIVGKNSLCNTLKLANGYGKKRFNNANILLAQSRITYKNVFL